MIEAVKLRRSGMAIDTIAYKLGTSKGTVIEILKANMSEAEYDRCKTSIRRTAFNAKRRRQSKGIGVTEKQATEILELRRLRYSYQDIAHQVKTSKANAIAVVHRDMPKSERDEIDDEVHRRRVEGLKHGYREGEISGCAKRWARQWVALPAWEA